MMFSLIIFLLNKSAMDNHSKGEVLEMFNMNEKLLLLDIFP